MIQQPDIQREILRRLNEMGIAFSLLEHEAVQNMSDCLPNARRLGAVMPKNLFLTPRSRKALYLAVTRPDVPFRTADVSRQLGSARLSFAPEELLMEYLRTKPGAISPFGLLFGAQSSPTGQLRVLFAMDRALAAEPMLAFHPCVSTATVALRTEEFFRFLRALHVDIHWFDADAAPDC